MLVWYRDTSYGNDNHVDVRPRSTLPSVGSKGGLLLVDSHFDPLRHTGAALDAYTDEEHDPSLENFPARMNASDVAFTRWGTNPAQDCFAVTTTLAQVLLHARTASRGTCRLH